MFKKEKQNDTTNSENKRLKNHIFRFLSLLIVFFTLTPTIFEASTMYLLSFTYNLEGKMITPSVSHSDVTTNIENHAELKNGAHYLYNESKNVQFMMNDSNYNNIDGSKIMNINVPSKISGFEKRFANERKHYPKKYESILPYSFPGNHVGISWVGAVMRQSDEEARNATAQDEAQAYFVGDQLASGFNRLLTIAYNAEHPGNSNVTGDQLHATAQKIAQMSVAGGSASFGTGNNKVTITQLSERAAFEAHPNINKGFYKTFKITGGDYVETVTLPVAVNKGYDDGANAKMKSAIENTPYHTSGKHKFDVYALTWENMVMQAGNNASNGIYVTDVQDLNPPGALESMILGLFSPIEGAIRSMLGLVPISDLVFNLGVQSESTIWGTIPQSMGPVADFIYMISLILALLVGLGSFVSLVIKSNLSVMNPQMRVDIKDGFMTIIGAMFILVTFKPMWNSMMRLNYYLVDFFFAMTNNTIDLRGAFALGNGFAAIILAIAFLVVEIWFNFYYITRSITILVLYMFAPLMIISISYGGQHKRIFENWAKEITGALFTQSIQAAVLGVLTIGISRGLASSAIWQYVILISIIPLSNLIREGILGLGGGSIGTTAERAEKGAMMTGAIGAGLAMKGASVAGSAAVGKLAGDSSGTGGGAGGGGGGGGSRSSNNGQQKLGDSGVVETKDLSPGATSTGSERQSSAQQEAQEAKLQLSDNPSMGERAKVGAAVASQTGKEAVGKMKEAGNKALNHKTTRAVGSALNSDVVRSGASAVSQVAGGIVTAGAAVGDVATDGGSSSATLAASRIISQGSRGRGGGGGSGGFTRPTSTSEILDNAPSQDYLDELKDNNHIGKHGALVLQENDDGSQTLTMDKGELGVESGYMDAQAFNASEEYENGMTRMTYDSTSMHDTNRNLIEDASQITNDYHTQKNNGTLTDETESNYHNLRASTGIAGVSVVGEADSGSPIYSIDLDNQAMGWDGTATDNNNLHVKANARTTKNPPNFNNVGPATKRMNRNLYGQQVM